MAKSGRTTVLTLASDLGLGLRYVPLPGSVLMVPLMVRFGRVASSATSAQRTARISPIRAAVASIRSMMSAMSLDAFGSGRCLAVHARRASRTVVRSSRVSYRVSDLSPIR